jgi:polyhydroxybutyrate depolymerase
MRLPMRRPSTATVVLTAVLVLVATGSAGGQVASYAGPPSDLAGRGDDAAGATTTTTTTHTIRIPGERRTYRLVVPATAVAGAPLVVALHGLYGSGERFQQTSGWDGVAEAAGAVLVYPDSYTAGWRSAPTETQDVLFLSKLVKGVTRRQGTDPRRVYVVGNSSGAFMSYRFACDRADLVAAIGPVAGAPLTDCAEPPSRPVPVISVHGKADTVVPYNGGHPQLPGQPPSDVELPSAHEMARRWVAHNGCRPRASRARTGPVVTRTWGHCDRHARVRLISIARWPHEYPTTAAGAPVDAPTVQWSFLQRYRVPRTLS